MEAFLERCGWTEAAREPLAGDASFRRYTRLRQEGRTAMLMDAPPPQEDVRPYLAIARHLSACGYAAPCLLGEDAAQGFVLLEDLGDALFTPALAQDNRDEPALYRAAVGVLAAWAKNPAMRNGKLPMAPYDTAAYLREAELFAEWLLPQLLPAAQRETARAEYSQLWRDILRENSLPAEIFVHRDYHADNLIWLPKRQGVARVGLLDFQDALVGHAAYDLVSLLEDARRDVPKALAAELREQYMRETGVNREDFLRAYAVLGAQRNCKILGIFVRLWRRDGKAHYLSYLPRVWRHLEGDLQHPALERLRAWMDRTLPEAARGALPVHG
ncbi:MAG: phosphotransferase [Alphaproteobacteria bacterium]|nr:phosphotransferase [Alphaproteobacteria bacterium]